MNSDQIITALNEMSSSKEGMAEVAKLMSAFKQDQKINGASEVLKAQSGAALRSAQRQEYRNAMNEYRNDDEMNKYRRGYLRDMARERANAVQVPTSETHAETPGRRFDRGEYRDIAVKHNILDRQTRTDYDGDVHERYRVANPGDRRVLIKKAKAAATEGFDESMYNFDPNQTFDRDRFRDRKRVARTINPEWNWRQRRAFALKDGEGIQNVVSRTIDLKDPNIELSSVWNKKLDIPGFTRGKATVSVGNIGIADVEHLPEEKRYTLVTEEAKIAPKRMGFNQFAGMLDDRIRAQKSLSTGSDTTNFQAWRANEYKKYAADPGNYTWTAMPDGYKASRQEMRQLAAEGLLANKRGTGYYDPNDNSQAYIFGNKSWMQQHLDKGLDPTKRTYSFVDQYGNPVTNEQELAIAAAQITDPAETVRAQEQNVGKIGESDFSRAMHNTALGIAGSAGVMAALDAGAAKMVWDGTKWVVKNTGRYFDDVIQRGRSVYGRQLDDAARAYMRNHGGHGVFQPQRWAGQYTYNQLPGGQMAGRIWQWVGGKPSFGSFIGGHAPYVPGNMIMPFLKEGGKIEK